MDCMKASQEADPHIVIESISRLDQAIIIAGPAGEGRLELILHMVKRIQMSLPTKGRPTLSSVFSTLDSPPQMPSTFSSDIPELDTAPSLATFLMKRSRCPFILRGFVRDWPAVAAHPWSSVEYLLSVAGPGRLVPVEIGHDYRTDDWTQRLMPWDEFLGSLLPKEIDNSEPVLYLAQHDLLKQFPALRDDIEIPDYVYASPSSPDNYPAYSPPANDDQLVINAWLGPSGTVSPAHTVRFECHFCLLALKPVCRILSSTYTVCYPLYTSVK